MLPVACASAEMIEDTACDLFRGFFFFFRVGEEEICFSFDFSQIFFNFFFPRSQGEKKRQKEKEHNGILSHSVAKMSVMLFFQSIYYY